MIEETEPIASKELVDGSTTSLHSHAGGSGDMTKAVYDPAAKNAQLAAVTDLHDGTAQDTAIAGKEPANANIQTHVISSHAPSDAQKNSDITKTEIEAKLTGELASHSHALLHSNSLDHNGGTQDTAIAAKETPAGAQGKVDAHKDLDTGVHGVGAGIIAKTADITKTAVGLANCENTSDANKPVSTAQQTALNGKVSHSLATALSDFLVASGAGAFIKKTLAEVKAILELGTAAYTAATNYVTHSLATAANDFLIASGSGVFIKKTLAETLTILGKAAASGLASLDASSKVVQEPASKGAASGIAPLDAASKVPTVNLGGGGADNAKYLRGDQAWATPGGGDDARIIVDALTTGEQFDVANSTTLVKITALDQALSAGTYTFKYVIIYRSNNVAGGIRYAVSFSGTNGAFVWWWRWADKSATASTSEPNQANVQAAGAVQGSFSARAKSTTTQGTTLSVETANADMMVIIEGVFVATGSGNLELWTASEVSTAGYTTSTMIGTSVVIVKTK